MYFTQRKSACRKAFFLLLLLLADGLPFNAHAQAEVAVEKQDEMKQSVIAVSETKTAVKPLVVSVLPNYYNAQDGVSIKELIKRALESNLELTAARLEIEKAKARLQQARLKPNPTLEFEQQSGRLIGNGGEGSFSIGASLPVEIYGRREARINFANIEIEASEAEVRNRERALTANILTNYSSALGALRELESLEKILELDLQTARFVQIRVNEGEIAPLEFNLLQAEIERLRARHQLAEGKLQSSLTQIKLLAGIPFDESIQLREQITTAILPALPSTSELALEIALKTRPDLFLAQIEEQAATAGLRLIRAQSKPDLTAYTRFSQGNSSIDLPTGSFPQQRDRRLSFGVAIGIPIFNKNQGAKAEAEISIKQAQQRREFTERAIRSEILSAYQRFEAASRAVSTLQNAAIPRSTENVETFRRVYEIGEIKITDLIAEQRRLLDMNRDLTDALTEKYRAQADLQIAFGASALLPDTK